MCDWENAAVQQAPSKVNQTSCKPAPDLQTCQARCDGAVGCNAINFNSSHGCCLERCSTANASSTPGPPKEGGSCCGAFRQSGGPLSRDVTVMMRAIDIVGLSRNKLLLWSVPVGKGHIIATGLKLLSAHIASAPSAPEQQWVLDRLLRYAGSLLQ